MGKGYPPGFTLTEKRLSTILFLSTDVENRCGDTRSRERVVCGEWEIRIDIYALSSVQFSRSVVSDSLRPHESQHARPPCPSPTPGVHSDSRPSSQ